jgi:multidrug efflux pump subunit AcrA (membrane-fusion protein)
VTEPTPETTTTTTTPAPKATLTAAEHQAALDAAAAAARREGEKAGRKAAEDAAAQAKRDAEAAAELDRKTKAGEFESVKATIEKDRDDWKARAEAAEARVAAIEERDGKKAEDLAKALPAALKPLYPATLPLDDRLAWLEKAVATADGATPAAGNARSPQPAGAGKPPTVESVREEMRRHRGLHPVGIRR